MTLTATSGGNHAQAKLTLPGDVSIGVLPGLIKQQGWLTLPILEVDFTGVTKADSAILAMLLFWAKRASTPLKITGFPKQLDNLITLYDLQSVVCFEPVK